MPHELQIRTTDKKELKTNRDNWQPDIRLKLPEIPSTQKSKQGTVTTHTVFCPETPTYDLDPENMLTRNENTIYNMTDEELQKSEENNNKFESVQRRYMNRHRQYERYHGLWGEWKLYLEKVAK